MSPFYDLIMKPLESRRLSSIRKHIISHAQGKVLEIGIGTGVNLQYYRKDLIEDLNSLDLNHQLSDSLIESFGFSHRLHIGRAENLPFADSSFDTVVETLTLCSVLDLEQTLSEIFRVLKPGGKFIFLDHVEPSNEHHRLMFKFIDKFWHRMAGGCRVIRNPHLQIATYPIQWLLDGTQHQGIFKYGVVEKLKI
jgi:ubiquinone/menaquinone biosynthesis C-methylase UbiE